MAKESAPGSRVATVTHVRDGGNTGHRPEGDEPGVADPKAM